MVRILQVPVLVEEFSRDEEGHQVQLSEHVAANIKSDRWLPVLAWPLRTAFGDVRSA
jgi:hypothetical protein